jgi:hypothetical protein
MLPLPAFTSLATNCYVNSEVQVKTKFTVEQAMNAQSGSTGIGLLFLYPRRQRGLAGQRVTLTPVKNIRYPLYRKLGGRQGLYGRVGKISPPPELDPWTIQLVASHYTEYAIPANFKGAV